MAVGPERGAGGQAFPPVTADEVAQLSIDYRSFIRRSRWPRRLLWIPSALA